MSNGKPQIALVGLGRVGAAAAYALILGSVAAELLLVDVKTDLRDGHVHDLTDAAYCSNSRTRVRAATYQEAAQCDIIIITAGSRISIGETGIQHTYHTYDNVRIIRTIMKSLMPIKSDAILVVVSNPVDLLTTLCLKLSGLPPNQVLGSGTYLDSIRLRGILAEKIRVQIQSVDLDIVGVHGEYQVVAWSCAAIRGASIGIPVSIADRAELADECRVRSQEILQAKGASPFGIGSTIYRICASVLTDERLFCPISHLQPEFGCCFSLPVVLGRKGIIGTIRTPLTSQENTEIAQSAKALKVAVDRIEEDVT